MQRRDSLIVGEYYHIYNRGVNKNLIFNDQNDYYRFIKSIFLFNSDKSLEIGAVSRGNTYRNVFFVDRGNQLVDIGAYCLMPNHFHFLIKQKVDNGISIFFKKVLTGHSMFYNKKYKRTGPLFEGRFKSKLISNDEYLSYLFAYIHLNPVKIQNPSWKDEGIDDPSAAEAFLRDYRFSSYNEYANNKPRPEERIINKKEFPEYFDSCKEFRNFMNNWLNYKEEFEILESEGVRRRTVLL